MNILLVAYICWHVTLNLHFRFAVSSIIWNRYWLFDLIKCELNETRRQRDYSGYFVLNILLDECLRFFFPQIFGHAFDIFKTCTKYNTLLSTLTTIFCFFFYLNSCSNSRQGFETHSFTWKFLIYMLHVRINDINPFNVTLTNWGTFFIIYDCDL